MLIPRWKVTTTANLAGSWIQKETAPNSGNRRLLKSVIPSEAEEWSESGGRDMDGQTDRSRERERASQSPILIC